MNKSEKLRVGILGCGQVGKIHARHYHELGEKVTRILCKSKKNAELVAEFLKKNYDFQAIPTSNLDDFFSEDLDIVSICSPPSFHFDHIKACLNQNIPVFCEKPLFWNENMKQKQVFKQLNEIKKYQNRLLTVNTCNTVFIDSILKSKSSIKSLKEFSFEFYTNGDFKGIDIAKDLLPHGFSLLIHMLGDNSINDYSYQYSNQIFKCMFKYGKCSVKFDFRENPLGPKHMKIGLNGENFIRHQVGEGSNFSVSLINENTNDVINVEDPFKVYIRNFIALTKSKEIINNDGFFTAALNMKKISSCLDLA
jgi:hypothetical protein